MLHPGFGKCILKELVCLINKGLCGKTNLLWDMIELYNSTHFVINHFTLLKALYKGKFIFKKIVGLV